MYQASYAAFTATTTNPANSWAAGSVSLADSQGGDSSGAVGTALFSAAGLTPGSTGTKCIKVTYNGTVDLSAGTGGVKFYVKTADLTGTGLGTYLRLSVDEGTVGANADCSDFGGTITNLYNPGDATDTSTLADFTANHNTWANGVSSWQPTAAAQFRTYRIKWTLLDNSAAEGLTATATFSWEADS
ncbi:MAG: hypothetical protein ACRDNS_27375 [Trebonia sp.]